ncbi:MAG TPA: DUF1360 domain-containing protein [Armatimonadota bacterium]|nr:DUF1360 domain-containing protein [Armatimonadota bacterium]
MSDYAGAERDPQITPTRKTRGRRSRPQNGGGDTNHPADELQDRDLFAEYGAPPDWPMESYAFLVALYNAGFVGFLLGAKKAGIRLPERIPVADLLLLGVATHRLSRLITKDWVTSPIRAAFTRYQGPGDAPAETKEKARGRGLRHAIGELLSCPWCAGQWAATLLTYGLIVSPRITRLAASILAIDDLSNVLNTAYSAAEKSL